MLSLASTACWLTEASLMPGQVLTGQHFLHRVPEQLLQRLLGQLLPGQLGRVKVLCGLLLYPQTQSQLGNATQQICSTSCTCCVQASFVSWCVIHGKAWVSPLAVLERSTSRIVFFFCFHVLSLTPLPSTMILQLVCNAKCRNQIARECVTCKSCSASGVWSLDHPAATAAASEAGNCSRPAPLCPVHCSKYIP